MASWITYNYSCEKCNHDFSALVDKNDPTDIPVCPVMPAGDVPAEHIIVKRPNAFSTYDITGGTATKRRHFSK